MHAIKETYVSRIFNRGALEPTSIQLPSPLIIDSMIERNANKTLRLVGVYKNPHLTSILVKFYCSKN